MKILLVDDEVDFRKVMTARIRGWGHELIEAANGKEAIEAAKNKKPDMKVMDETGKLGINAFIPKTTPNVDVIGALKSAIDMIEKRLK